MAQLFPTLYKQSSTQTQSKDGKRVFEHRLLFDRVLCDVPCSSDAAMRKIPAKWDPWSPKEGLGLHPLQLKLLLRGIALLRVGGLISYSTCSLNPIENEAVVSAALRRLKGKVELISCEQALPQDKFRTRPGLSSWTVYDSGFRGMERSVEHWEKLVYKSFGDVPPEKRKSIRETMFCIEDEKTMTEEMRI